MHTAGRHPCWVPHSVCTPCSQCSCSLALPNSFFHTWRGLGRHCCWSCLGPISCCQVSCRLPAALGSSWSSSGSEPPVHHAVMGKRPFLCACVTKQLKGKKALRDAWACWPWAAYCRLGRCWGQSRTMLHQGGEWFSCGACPEAEKINCPGSKLSGDRDRHCSACQNIAWMGLGFTWHPPPAGAFQNSSQSTWEREHEPPPVGGSWRPLTL